MIKHYTHRIFSLIGLILFLFSHFGLAQSAQSSINEQNFPFVVLNLSVRDASGGLNTDILASQITACENGAEQLDGFSVTLPGQTSGNGSTSRLVDIVFIQDNSSSLGGEIAAVRNNLFDFVTNIQNSNVDFALGLVRFGQSARGGRPIVEESGNLTTDATFFRDVVYARNRADGSFEPTFQAILEAANSFNFRPTAQRIFVVIGDESPVMGSVNSQQATDIAVNNSIAVFALAAPQYFTQFQQITSATGGNTFNITNSFDFILGAITDVLSQTYVVRYRSSQPNRDGVARTVDIKIKGLSTGDLQTTNTYTPGAIPIISLELSTKDLLEQAFDPGTPLEIATMIMDESAPFVQNAQLFYQNEGDATYQQLAMGQDAGTNIWRATIPQGFANTPAVNFYISATDGLTSVTSPSVDAPSNPFQISILPNVAPEIQHTPVESSSIFSDLTIDAVVSDVTQFVDEVTLFYRQLGDFLYQSTDMNSIGNDDYSGVIPANALTCSGTEYYIEATDDQNVSSTAGTVDDPFFVTGLAEECSTNPPPPPPTTICNVTVRTGANKILVDNLSFAHNKVVVYDKGFSQVIGRVAYEDNFQGNKVFENIPTGEYAIQIQTFTAQFAEIGCDTIIYVTVTNQDIGPDCPNLGLNFSENCDDGDANTNNDIVRTDCTCQGDGNGGSNTCNVVVSAGDGSIIIKNLDFPLNRILILDPQFSTTFKEISFGDNVQGEVTIPNLSKGHYKVKVQSYTQGFGEIKCDDIFDIEITNTGNGGPPSGNLCDNLSVTTGNGQITVSGLVGPNEIVDFMGEHYNKLYTCGHECGDTQTLEGLSAGNYFVNVKSYSENWERLECSTLIPVEVMIGADGRSRDLTAFVPENFNLFPNPVFDEVLFLNLRTLNGQSAQLELFNQYGQSVWQKRLASVNKDIESIDVSTFQNGVYYLKIDGQNKPTITKKLKIIRMY